MRFIDERPEPKQKPATVPTRLADVLYMFHICVVNRIAPDQIADAILSAPAWVRLGIAAPGERLRRQAALELARTNIGEDQPDDRNQLCLRL